MTWIPALAGESLVLIDGTGCRTRQLAIERIFEKIPGVTEVTILRREEAPAENQRYFRVKSTGESPGREQFIEALARRAKHYRILSVTPADAATVKPGAESR